MGAQYKKEMRMKTNIFTMISVVLSLMVVQVDAQTAGSKVGYVDMERALQSTKAGQGAKKEVEKEIEKRKKALDKLRNDVVKMEDDLKKQELVLTAESREKKKSDYLKKVEDLRNLMAKSQQEMQEVEQKIASPILVKMSEVLKKLSEEKGYDVIVAKGALVYARDESDLTDDLIKRFDKEYKGK
jgi:outer membrane protein